MKHTTKIAYNSSYDDEGEFSTDNKMKLCKSLMCNLHVFFLLSKNFITKIAFS